MNPAAQKPDETDVESSTSRWRGGGKGAQRRGLNRIPAWILLPVIGGVAGASVLLGVTAIVPPTYESSATLVYVPTSLSSSGLVVTQDVAFATVPSDSVLQPVAAAAGLSVADLRDRLSMSEPLVGGGVVRGATMQIRVSATRAAEAADLATGIAEGAVERSKDIGVAALATQGTALRSAIDTLQAETSSATDTDPARAPLSGQLASVQDQLAQLEVIIKDYQGPLAVTQSAAQPKAPSSLAGVRGAVVGFGLGFALGVVLALVGWPGRPRDVTERP